MRDLRFLPRPCVEHSVVDLRMAPTSSEFWAPTGTACGLEVALSNYVCLKVDLRMVVSTSIIFARDASLKDLTRRGNPQG